MRVNEIFWFLNIKHVNVNAVKKRKYGNRFDLFSFRGNKLFSLLTLSMYLKTKKRIEQKKKPETTTEKKKNKKYLVSIKFTFLVDFFFRIFRGERWETML